MIFKAGQIRIAKVNAVFQVGFNFQVCGGIAQFAAVALETDYDSLNNSWLHGSIIGYYVKTMTKLFSQELEDWIRHGRDKTLGGLIELFEEKAFAIIFLVMMALPALPIPTGGVTHITELITILGSLQLLAGRRTIWLPKKWLKHNAGRSLQGKGGRRFIKVIKWFENFSRPRWSSLLATPFARSILGLLVTLFTVAAFVSPPFSGLDTLPSLGVVILSLGMIFEDVLVVVLGIVVGAIGIGVEVAAGASLYRGLRHFI